MKQLAEQCVRTDELVTFSKFEVAKHQLDAAIYNLLLGNWPASITLAGAVEETLPKLTTKEDLFAFLKKKAALDENIDSDSIGKKLNTLRNWSKHYSMELAGDQQFSQIDAITMILRAHSRLYFQDTAPENNYYSTPTQEIFVEWFKANFRDWLEPQNNHGKTK